MQFLFPCDPFNKQVADENYQEEFTALQGAGLSCYLFSLEDALEGKLRVRPTLVENTPVVYRGWMLREEEYGKLSKLVESYNCSFLTSKEQYMHCHHLPYWYVSCKAFTPATVLCKDKSQIDATLAHVNWSRYFVKDFVKSLTTSRGSVANSVADVHELVDLLVQYRGSLEGGICLREFEDFDTTTEERYFVWKGRAYGRKGVVPDLVNEIATRIASPFFTVDVAMRRDGVLRLIEVGDGQVSDRKQWNAAVFAAMLTN